MLSFMRAKPNLKLYRVESTSERLTPLVSFSCSTDRVITVSLSSPYLPLTVYQDRSSFPLITVSYQGLSLRLPHWHLEASQIVAYQQALNASLG